MRLLLLRAGQRMYLRPATRISGAAALLLFSLVAADPNDGLTQLSCGSMHGVRIAGCGSRVHNVRKLCRRHGAKPHCGCVQERPRHGAQSQRTAAVSPYVRQTVLHHHGSNVDRAIPPLMSNSLVNMCAHPR